MFSLTDAGQHAHIMDNGARRRGDIAMMRHMAPTTKELTVIDTIISTEDDATPVILVSKDNFADWAQNAPESTQAWLKSNRFKPKPGQHVVIPGADGSMDSVIAGISTGTPDMWDVAQLARSLPVGDYALQAIDGAPAQDDLDALALGWILDGYRFDTYKKKDGLPARLYLSADYNEKRIRALADATFLTRDLINTPANILGPEALAEAATRLAVQYGAEYEITVGDDLLKNNYPAIHAVGRAATDQPRLIELTWGSPDNPTVALVGKGVCFDSGGLDIKGAAGMKIMKKDMGGSANVLGIAQAIMALELPIHLKVLIPAVENAIAGNAMRPLDIVETRAGTTIEIGNTDAEGRVILADAITRAAESNPELMIDFATLTGAARVALGTELPAFFCDDDEFTASVLDIGMQINDPLWRMPLWQPYRKMVDGKSADLTNSPDGGYGGAITAALFLQHFAPEDVTWAHIDLMAWNLSNKPGRPEGGEAMGMRAIFSAIEAKYT